MRFNTAIEKEIPDRVCWPTTINQKPEELIGANSLLKQLTKAFLERALHAEISVHLGHGNMVL